MHGSVILRVALSVSKKSLVVTHLCVIWPHLTITGVEFMQACFEHACLRECLRIHLFKLTGLGGALHQQYFSVGIEQPRINARAIDVERLLTSAHRIRLRKLRRHIKLSKLLQRNSTEALIALKLVLRQRTLLSLHKAHVSAWHAP